MIYENLMQTIRLMRVRHEKRREVRRILHNSKAVTAEEPTNVAFFFV